MGGVMGVASSLVGFGIIAIALLELRRNSVVSVC